MSVERLQKVLARAGLASRRKAEELIVAGRVKVDGRVVTELGTRVDPRKSRVEVDGNKIVSEAPVYVVLHKPRAVVSTMSDPEGRPTVGELVRDVGARVVPVGRLDFHTSGVLLMTNDGDFAEALTHPKKQAPKQYVAKVQGRVSDEELEAWRESIVIDGRPTRPAVVRRLRWEGDKTWLLLTLREGRNRQVRRLGDATGFAVMRLARTEFAGITIEGLRPGEWRYLTADELVALKKTYGVPRRVRAAAQPGLAALRKGKGGARKASGVKRGAASRSSGAPKARAAKPGGGERAKPAGGQRGERAAAKPAGGQRGGRAAAQPAGGQRGGRAAAKPAGGQRGGRAAAQPAGGQRGGRAAAKPAGGQRGGRAAAKPAGGQRGGRAAAQPAGGQRGGPARSAKPGGGKRGR